MLVNSKNVKVGVLMDSLECSPYLFDTISSLAKDQNIELYLLLNSSSRNKSSINSVIRNIYDIGIRRSIDTIFFTVCVSLDRKICTDKPIDLREHFLTRHINTEIFTDKVLIKPKISKNVNSKRAILVSYDDLDIQKVNALDLDMILRGNATGIFQGKILSTAKEGIISFHHGDNRWNRGTPPGFWEVYFKKPATGFIIQILNENLDDGDVIFRGEVPTTTSYFSNLVNLYQAANPFMARTIRSYAATGALPPILPKIPYSNTLLKVPRFTVMLAYLIRTGSLSASLSLKRKILKRYERWSVAFIKSDWTKANLSKATVIRNPKGRFLADPFIVDHDDKTVIFVEDYHYSSDLGVISGIKIFPDGSYKIVPDIIKENFHLSFPYVFKYMGDIYMIPESRGAKTIRLYKCIRFPDKWEYQFDIMKSVSTVDTMVFEHSGRWWMLTNIAPEGASRLSTQLCAFSADSPLSKDWQPHPKNPICFSVEFGRNGGILRDRDGTIYRVRQRQGFGQYGAAMSIAKITKLDLDGYDEALYCEIEPKFLPNLAGAHHMHCNREFTVFDFMREESLK